MTRTERLDPPAPAGAVFGERLDLARQFAELLASDGVARGLLGPHEAARLWERHLLNCAVVTDLVPTGARVVDVGSGAGLPGLVFAIRRPDLRVDLVEPLQRRVTFLDEAVHTLRLADRVRVVRGRAEEPSVVSAVGAATWVTARAVAPLDRLVRWCLPLLQSDGRLLALKGATAAAEVREHQPMIMKAGGRDVTIVYCGAGLLDEPTAVVVVQRRTVEAPPVRKGRE